MKIGIDARMYRSSVAGISRYSQNLIKNLLEIDKENEYILFMTSDDIKEFKNSKSEILISKQIPNSKFKIIETNIPHYSLTEQTKFGKIIENEHLDLMHFVNFNYPINYSGKFIVTIHDLTLLLFPDTARESNMVKRFAFLYVMKKAIENAQKIIAVSNNTKKDIINKFKVKNNKLKVIYEAADDKTFNNVSEQEVVKIKSKYNINNASVILYVGQFRPHKNLPSLVEAFNIVNKDIRCKLVLIGKVDPKHKRLLESIDKSPQKRDIIMPGFVSNLELSIWYKIADVFCFPSLYEGFGLPGLEAMQFGTAVVASNASSLPEIYKTSALYFDPFNIADIADKIKTVLSNAKVRNNLIKNGKKLIKTYSWRETAQETLKIYNSIN